MVRKYGKTNEISIDPLSYNIGLLGEPGIGKSTLIKEVCEKLVGKDGYIMLDVYRESGHSAIPGIVTQPVPTWQTFVDIVNDIILNKTTDYADLRVIVIDTIDQMLALADQEIIRQHNADAKNDKKISSINAALGGFGKGEMASACIILDKLWDLKEVGVSFIVIGHTRKREIADPVSEQTYVSITTDVSQRVFSLFRNKLHVLGIANIDREIVKQKSGKKNPVTHGDIYKGKTLSESRVINFRDDDYTIDSKSRFKDIAESIPLDADEFIKAIKDAIMAAHAKGSKTIEESNAELHEQRKQMDENSIKAAAKIGEKRDAETVAQKIEEIKEAVIVAGKLGIEKSEIASTIKGVLAFDGKPSVNYTKITSIEDAKSVLDSLLLMITNAALQTKSDGGEYALDVADVIESEVAE